MNYSNRLIVRGMIYALSKLKEPLPKEVALQLKEISPNLQDNLGKLHVIGKTHLKGDYHFIQDVLHTAAVEQLSVPQEYRYLKEWDDETLLEKLRSLITTVNWLNEEQDK